MKEISLHILDLVQNSIRAKATVIEINVAESRKNNSLRIDIKDNGTGMSKEMLEKVTDPFFTSRTTRKVGLGVSLYLQLVEQCKGHMLITSEEGKGTKLSSEMELDHIDRQPMGDIAGVWVLLVQSNPGIRFIYTHVTESGSYIADTEEIKSILGNGGLYGPGILKYMKEMIRGNLDEINTNC